MTDTILNDLYPGESHRHFSPMKIGSTSEHADQGADLILAGIKTATSSAHWHYPDGRIPFVGALSVLIDGADRPRGVVETVRVELRPFSSVDAAFARAYGEGPRTLDWFRREIGDWYREEATRHGHTFGPDTTIICEWFTVAARLDDR